MSANKITCPCIHMALFPFTYCKVEWSFSKLSLVGCWSIVQWKLFTATFFIYNINVICTNVPVQLKFEFITTEIQFNDKLFGDSVIVRRVDCTCNFYVYHVSLLNWGSPLLLILKFSWGFYFRETLRMRSFGKIKPSRNGEKAVSFTDVSKSCQSRKFLMWQIQ